MRGSDEKKVKIAPASKVYLYLFLEIGKLEKCFSSAILKSWWGNTVFFFLFVFFISAQGCNIKCKKVKSLKTLWLQHFSVPLLCCPAPSELGILKFKSVLHFVLHWASLLPQNPTSCLPLFSSTCFSLLFVIHAFVIIIVLKSVYTKSITNMMHCKWWTFVKERKTLTRVKYDKLKNQMKQMKSNT